MRTVFLDTVGLLALWDEAGQWHKNAADAMERLSASACRFVSSSPVLMECGNAAARTPYRKYVTQFRQELADFANLLMPTQEDELRAWAAYARGEAGEAGIVDHFSFAIMRRLDIAEAFTNDKHFLAAGFVALF